MKDIFKLIFGIILGFCAMSPVFATEIPKPIADFILQTFPKTTFRFDGFIELPDGSKYLPVLPINYAKTENPAKIVKTIPANASLSSKPDLVLFDNDLALLRVIKLADGTKTLSNSSEIPLKVKLGILPQDLVVPDNLVLPPELRVIAGDLKIAVSQNADTALVNINNINGLGAGKHYSISNNNAGLLSTFPELKDLANRTFYATNYQSNLLYIIFPQTGRPIKTLSLSSIPSDLAITDDQRYLLITCLASNKVSIIDTLSNNFISEIEVGKLPISIVIPNSTYKAYVANRASSDISVIDLRNMEVMDNISITGFPTNLAISENRQYLYYSDAVSGKIYRLNLEYKDPDDKIKEIMQVSNPSKILPYDKYILVLSRSGNTLSIYDPEQNKLFKTIEVGKKPVDIKVSKDDNKAYVLSAGSNCINIINLTDFTILSTIPLKETGFYKNLNLLGATDKAIVSNVDSYEVAIVDLKGEKVMDYLPVGTLINSLVISQTVK